MKHTRKQAALAVFVLSLALILTASLVMLVQAAVPWTKQGDLSLGGELYVEEASVIWDETASLYKMWYTHGKTDLSISDIASSLAAILNTDIITDIASLDLNALLNDLSVIDANALYTLLADTTTVISYATSVDGITWTLQNSSVLTGSNGGAFDNVGSPSIIRNDATDYEMWYTHNTTELTETELGDILTDLGGDATARRNAILELIDAARTEIGYTTSTDGVAWDPPGFGVFSGSGGAFDSVGDPNVIWDGTDNKYKMWYTQSKTDVTTTTLDTIMGDLAGFGVAELWNILDGTGSVIGYATSDDGITGWTAGVEVLAEGSGLWDSASSPSVIKIGSSYEMWFTHGSTDLDSSGLGTILDELLLLVPKISDLWASYDPGDLGPFITNFIALIDNNTNMNNIKAMLADTNTVISYATSGNGTSWTVEDAQALVGANSSLWASVSNPSVVWQDGVYEIWFTQGIDDLTAQNLLSLMDGTILPIGYAIFGVSIDLVSGWNFIGLPVTPASSAIGDVLADIIDDVLIVWHFDSTADPIWSSYTPTAPFPSLTDMTEGKGYWVKMTNPRTLIVASAEPPLPYAIPLVDDWNLISLPETPSSSAIGDVLAGIIDDVLIVWHFDSTADPIWSSYTPTAPFPTLTEMTEGKAYWIKMAVSTTLTIN